MRAGNVPLTSKSAHVVHFTMVVAIAAAAAVSWVIRDLVIVDVGPTVRRVLRYVAVADLVVVGLVVAHLRANVAFMTSGDDADAWWAANGTRILTTWVLTYSASVMGIVLWLVTGDLVILAAVVLASVLLLMRLAPTRWRAEESEHRSGLVP